MTYEPYEVLLRLRVGLNGLTAENLAEDIMYEVSQWDTYRVEDIEVVEVEEV
jgi:hypothetical protein